MKKLLLLLVLGSAGINFGFAQQTYYDVTSGNGYGLRFWQSDAYKIHMGNSSEYLYGPVTDYSIKSNMYGGNGRGWTWGTSGVTPVAALNVLGNMQIAGPFTSGGNIINNSPTNGALGLTGDLPGYSNGQYPTLKTNGNYLYFSAVGKYTAYLGGGTGDAAFGLHDASTNTTVLLNTNGNSYLNGGNVGIGTTTLSAKLTVAGPNTGSGVAINAAGGGDVLLNSGGSLFFDGNYSYASGNYIRPVASNTQAHFTSGVERMRITPSGYVGIGTTQPDYPLTVNGSAHAKEVRVDLNVPGPDYVFEKEYKLTSLEDIKSYIDQNKHLPEVPSAREMEKNGVQLGEMNMILLKKIEELTLHIIKQEERMKEQLKKTTEQQSKIQEQEERIRTLETKNNH
jgi:hypothetical protein